MISFQDQGGKGQFSGSLYLSMMPSDKMTHKRHHILCLLMERWKKVSDISQPPISTTAAAMAQLPHCCSWRPTVPCCLGVMARAHSPPSSGVLETYYYLRFLIQQCPVCICDKYLDNIILVHIYILAQRRCTQKYSIYGKSDLSLTLSYVIQHDRSTADIKLYVQAIFFTINTYC